MNPLDWIGVTIAIVLIVVCAAGIDWSWRKHVDGKDE